MEIRQRYGSPEAFVPGCGPAVDRLLRGEVPPAGIKYEPVRRPFTPSAKPCEGIPCHSAPWFILLLITGLFSWASAPAWMFDCLQEPKRLKTAASITPALVCLLTVVTMFCQRRPDVLTGFLRPVTQLIGFPAEVLPLALLRPVSGSGGTACCTSCWGIRPG